MAGGTKKNRKPFMNFMKNSRSFMKILGVLSQNQAKVSSVRNNVRVLV